ncbi:MAG: hypothetical protein AAB922_01165 [Patescibacteria group bacterium]
MGILLGLFIRAAVWFGAGVGATSLVDKFFPDKLPAGVAPLSNTTDSAGRINWIKVVFIVVIGAIAIVLTRWLAKKMNISILK